MTILRWQPAQDETVVLSIYSTLTGALVNRRLCRIKKITQSGYVHLDGVLGQFIRASDATYCLKRRKQMGMFYRNEITLADEEAKATLPRSSFDGRQYARKITIMALEARNEA